GAATDRAGAAGAGARRFGSGPAVAADQQRAALAAGGRGRLAGARALVPFRPFDRLPGPPRILITSHYVAENARSSLREPTGVERAAARRRVWFPRRERSDRP